MSWRHSCNTAQVCGYLRWSEVRALVCSGRNARIRRHGSALDPVREKATEVAGDRGAVAARGEAATLVADHPQAPDEVLLPGGKQIRVFLIGDRLAVVAGGSGGERIPPVHQANTRTLAAEERFFQPVRDALGTERFPREIGRQQQRVAGIELP